MVAVSSLARLVRTSLAVLMVVGSCALPEATKIDSETDGAAGSGGAARGGNSTTAGNDGNAGAAAEGGNGASSSAGSPGEGGMPSGGSSGSTNGGAGADTANGGGGASAGNCSEAGVWPDSTPLCSDGSQPPCPLASEDGSFEIVPASYTVDAGIVSDELTGLQWEEVATLAPPTTWSEANTYCQNLDLGGFDDWHLPSLLELSSIADYGRSQPATAADFSPETGFFWTSSLHPTGNHSGINFWYGLVASWNDNDNTLGSTTARCVRGAIMPGMLTPAGMILTDAMTKMEWRANASPTPLSWPGAIDFCESLGDCWRLPTVKELITIFVPQTADHLPMAFPPPEPSTRYWSSTPYLGDNTKAWMVDFAADGALEASADGVNRQEMYRARCVRSGPQ